MPGSNVGEVHVQQPPGAFQSRALLPRRQNTAEGFKSWTQFIGKAAKFNFLLMNSIIGTCRAISGSWMCFVCVLIA